MIVNMIDSNLLQIAEALIEKVGNLFPARGETLLRDYVEYGEICNITIFDVRLSEVQKILYEIREYEVEYSSLLLIPHTQPDETFILVVQNITML